MALSLEEIGARSLKKSEKYLVRISELSRSISKGTIKLVEKVGYFLIIFGFLGLRKFIAFRFGFQDIQVFWV